MKYKLFIFVAILSASFAVSNVHAATPAAGLDYCDGPQSFETGYDETGLCYTVRRGDTLWRIADTYLGDGFLWKYLPIRLDSRRQANANTYLGSPKKLRSGMKVSIPTSLMKPYLGYDFVAGSPVIDPLSGGIISWSRKYDGSGILTSGDSVYAGPYYFVRSIRVSGDQKHVVYLADTKPKEQRGCAMEYHGFQFVVDKVPNPHYSCGWDYKLLTFNPGSTEYAVRNDKGDGANPDQFLVLSSIGNGPYYDYLDSLVWVDDKTLVYRAQRNDEWRVVINHKDQKTFDYIDSVQVKDGAIVFHARQADGTWTDEKIKL